MDYVERRKEIFAALCRRRYDTVGNLTNEFGVCEKTIRNDLQVLMCSYPIKTMQGRYGGGVMILEWYQPKSKVLCPEQVRLLNRIAETLSGYDFVVLKSILLQFAA